MSDAHPMSGMAALANSGVNTSMLTIGGFIRNLVASTLGNFVSGAVLVGPVYWPVHLWPAEHAGEG